MKFSVFISLIICAVGLYLVKHIAYLYTSGKLYETLKRAIKKSLRHFLIGTAVLGLIFFALSNFALAREIGFSLFTTETIDSIRLLLDFLFETESFRISLQILGSATLFFVEFTLLFSILGSFISDPKTFGRGQTTLEFSSLFTNEQYRETFLCLKEYQFNDCFNTDYTGAGEGTAIQFTEGNHAMYRNAFYNADGTQKRESDEDYGVYTDENGKEYYLYVAKYPRADEESLYGNMFAVCSNTKYTQACMEVITLINTDPEIRNLLQYGIKQGEHRDGQNPNYKVNDDGTITVLNDMYKMDIRKTGNCFIAYPEQGNPANYWEDAKAQNNDALIDPLAGFNFNTVLDPTSGAKLDVRYLIDTAVAVNDKTGKETQIDTDIEKLNAIVLEGINNCGEDYAQLENYVNNVLAKNLIGNNAQIGTSPSMDLDKVTNKEYNPNKEDDNGNIDENGESPYAIYFKWASSLK